jgi:hypothetical protein
VEAVSTEPARTETSTQQRIPRGTRGAILNWFERYGARPDEILEQLQLREGFGDQLDLERHVTEIYGEAEAERLRTDAVDEIAAKVREDLGSSAIGFSASTTAPVRDEIVRKETPRALLLYLPDPLFARAIEAACEQQFGAYGEYGNAPPDAEPYVNGQFERVGAPYHLERGEVVWVGDETLNERAIEPALTALRDPRLATLEEDFRHAVDDVRKGTKRSRKDAVYYGTKVLEGAMVALLAAHGVAHPGKLQVWPLWEALRDAGVVAETMKELIVAGARVSNEKGRHSDPREVTQIEAEVSVTAVANAVLYLASLLPASDG